MSELRDFLNDRVFSSLDAAEAGLLDGLNPKRRGKYYSLDCPACRSDVKGSAFYYPFKFSSIQCNRRNNCTTLRTSIWDIVQSAEKLSNRETLERLCRAAGVAPPSSTRTAEEKRAISLSRAFFDVVRQALMASGAAMEYLRTERHMTEDEINLARIGYYPSESYVRDKLKALGANLKQAEEWGLIGEDEKAKARITRKFGKRIVGYWEQPDGSIRMWGRAFGESAKSYIDAGSGETVTPNKYEFSFGMVKTMPYRFRDCGRKGVLIAVEGMLDSERMVINSIPASGIGGAMVTADQAKYLVSHGVDTVIHLVDGDKAGYEGGLSTISNCEPVGITVYIATIPEDQDDPDNMIGNHGTEPLLQILDNAWSGGAYLARDMVEARKRMGLESTRIVQHHLIQRERLTPASRLAFDRYLRDTGQALPATSALALRLAGELVAAGLEMEAVNRIVKERYGCVVSVTNPEAGNG